MENLFLTFATLLNFHTNGILDANLTQFNFNFENDFIFQTDEYYNHSSRLDWIFLNKKINYIYNINIKQEMYTPHDHKNGYLIKEDMPYTSTLQVEFGTHKLTQNHLRSLNIAFGFTGKYTYAQESMDLIHSFLPTKPIYYGWETQKKTIPLLQLNFIDNYKYFLLKKNIDIILSYGVNGGNERSYIFTEVESRYAFNLPNDFGFYTVYSNHLNYKDVIKKEYFYILFGIRQNLIFNDITLRGLEMYHNQTVFYSGFVYKIQNFNVGIVLNKETKRFKQQKEDSYGYANILLGWSY